MIKYTANSLEGSENGLDDPLFNDCADFCRHEGRVSISTIQRKFKVSFYRACSLVKALEAQGFQINEITGNLVNSELYK